MIYSIVDTYTHMYNRYILLDGDEFINYMFVSSNVEIRWFLDLVLFFIILFTLTQLDYN